MAKGTFFGGEICIYLSEGEILNLGQLKLNGDELFHPSLEILLDTVDNKSLKTIVRKENFEDLNSDVKVDKTDYGFLVTINNKTYWGLIKNKFYDAICNKGNKVSFFKA